MTKRFGTVCALATLGMLAMTGCASPASSPASAAQPLKIFAAASLQTSFDELALAFAEKYPEYPVAPIQYDGSQALATQILDGADVDVIAFASERSFDPLLDSGATDAPSFFASNTLLIAVGPGNPKAIESLQDLADPDLSVVLCAVEVPCGAASHMLLDDAKLTVTPVSEETSVTGVVMRVTAGEADAGLVYATDIHDSDGTLVGIIPDNVDAAVNRYPIAVANDARSRASATAFLDFVLSAAGQSVLSAHGFGKP